jgi:hypothetical protein
MLNKTKLSIGLLAAGSALLAACGGGSSGPTITGAKPEGVYRFSATAGDADVLLLENNEAWIIGSAQLAAGPRLDNVFNAKSGSSNGATYSSSAGALKQYVSAGTVFDGSLNADYVSGTSFTATVSTMFGKNTFAATSPDSVDFDYNVAATIATIAGDWDGSWLGNDFGILSIDNGGAVTGDGVLKDGLGECVISGQITPRASNKNIFDVVLSYKAKTAAAQVCKQSGQSFTGNAVSYKVKVPTTAAGTTLVSKNQLIIVGTTADRASAEAFIAQKDVAVP